MNTEYMDSRIYNQQQKRHRQNINSGLLQYRSSPIDLLTSCLADGSCDDKELDSMLTKFMSSSNGWTSSDSVNEMNLEKQDSLNGHSYGSLMFNQTQQVQVIPDPPISGNAMDELHGVVLENSLQSRIGSNLTRQKSSPAALFSNSTIQNGFAAQKQGGSFKACNVSNGKAGTSTSTNISFHSKPSSCTMPMNRISAIKNESLGASSFGLGNVDVNNKCQLPSFCLDSWQFRSSPGLKNAVDFQHRNHGLTHYWSSTISSKMLSVEKHLHLQESVPCKIRARRGFATHPRSIAERIRRTRISERIKKLQDLFPDMDKQATTADMLDLAVQYIKDLQKQVKTLEDIREKCTCSSKRK